MNTSSGQVQDDNRTENPTKKFEGILEAARESILIADASMRIVASNRPSIAAFSRDGRPTIGMRLSELVRDASLHEAFRSALFEDKRSDLRIEIPGANRKILDVHVAPLDIDGAANAIGIFYDVTQIERLEHIRQEFLSNISHELRTPLTSILAFVETLEDGAIDDRENNHRFLEVIRRNAERMRALIADVLELSMIESGNVSLELREVSLDALVTDTFASLASQAKTGGITLENKVMENTVVRADPRRLEQVLTNLVDNAIKFNRDNGRVTVEYSNENGRHVILVSDEGEGMMPDQLNRIFERFYRADRARTSGIGGTGLGLAIVKHLTKLHGGDVAVRSTLGRGSTFTIELPGQ